MCRVQVTEDITASPGPGSEEVEGRVGGGGGGLLKNILYVEAPLISKLLPFYMHF